MTTHNLKSDGKPEYCPPAATCDKFLWILWIALSVAGVFGISQRFIGGHTAAGYGSYVPWGLWIGLYFLGVGISGGTFIIGTVGYLFEIRGFSKRSDLRTTIVLSLAALLPAFIGVTLDLGRPERLFNILAYPSFTSMMAFNGWMYNIFMVIAVIAWLLSFSDRSPWLKPILVTAAFFSVLFPSQSGVFFEAVRTNAFWHSPILSVLFLASAIALGGAGLVVVKGAMGPDSGSDSDVQTHHAALSGLRVVAAFAVIVYLVFEFAEFSIAFWNPGSHSPNVVYLLFGDYWPVFWILHVFAGSLIPLALFSTGSKGAWAAASVLLLVGFAAARMNVLIPGQIAGQIAGLQQAFQDVRLMYSYHPTTMEYLVGCSMPAVGMAVFYIGMRLTATIASGREKGA
ncbi:MAG: NrfD/PsrC family molybdoenzyme membrane anchor subunit [Pseudomonadota bacterium]